MKHLIALAFFALSVAANAATVTLSNGTSSCAYTGVATDAQGNMSVSCAGAPPPSVANFALSTLSPSIMQPNTAGSVNVARTGGPAESLMVFYSLTGCAVNNSGGIMMNPGTTVPVAFTTGGPGSTCTVAIIAPEGHTANPAALSFSVAQTPGCTPSGVQPDLGFSINQIRQPSGVTYAYPVPEPVGGTVVSILQGQMSVSTQTTTEYTVSTCPGKIDETAGICYYKSRNISYNTLDIKRVGAPNFSQCPAPSGQKFYLNVRWTYSSCPFGTCGFSMMWVNNW